MSLTLKQKTLAVKREAAVMSYKFSVQSNLHSPTHYGFIGCNEIIPYMAEAAYKNNLHIHLINDFKNFENIAASPTSKLHFHSTEAKVLEDSEIIFVGFQNELKCQKFINENRQLLNHVHFVDLTLYQDENANKEVRQVIEDEKGHYMYMYVFGGNDDVTQGNLIILADGSKDLFRYSSPCLNIWCKNVKFLGEDCLALKYGSLANVLKASFLSSLEEANNLCEINENLTDFSEILKTTGFDEFYSMPQKVCNCFSIVSFI